MLPTDTINTNDIGLQYCGLLSFVGNQQSFYIKCGVTLFCRSPTRLSPFFLRWITLTGYGYEDEDEDEWLHTERWNEGAVERELLHAKAWEV